MLRTEENIMKLTKKGEGEGEMKIWWREWNCSSYAVHMYGIPCYY
jgi:hypothetical protein